MRISHYDAVFNRGEDVTLPPDGTAPGMVLHAPTAANSEAGPFEDISAAGAVELQRALSGWLAAHKRLHPEWHATYRRDNPGGTRAAELRRQQRRGASRAQE